MDIEEKRSPNYSPLEGFNEGFGDLLIDELIASLIPLQKRGFTMLVDQSDDKKFFDEYHSQQRKF